MRSAEHPTTASAPKSRSPCQELEPLWTAPWTSGDDVQLAECHAELGERWAAIARRMPGRTAVQIKSRWHGKQRGKSGRKPTFLDAYIRNLQDAPAAAISGPHYAESAAEHRADALARARDLLASGVLADVKPRVPRPLHNRGRPCSSSGLASSVWQSGAGTAAGNGGGGAQKRQSTADADEDSADEYTVMGASPRPASALVAAAPAGGSSKKAAAAAARAARQKAAGRRGGRDDGSSDEDWGLASAGPRLSRRRSCSRYEAQSSGGGSGADGIMFASGSNAVFRSPGGDPTGATLALTLTPAAAAADAGATAAAEDSGRRLGLMRSPSAACETSGYVSAKSGSPLPLDIDDTTFETLLGMAEAEAEALPVLPFASSVTGPPPPPPAAPPRPEPQPDPQRQQQWQGQGQDAAMAAACGGDGRRAHRGGGGVAPPAGPAYAHSERRVMWLGDFLDPERTIAPPAQHTPAAAAAAAVYGPTSDFARSSSNVGSNTPNPYASRLSAAAAACNGYAARQRLQQSDWEWEDACDDVDCMDYDCGGSGGFSSANGGGGCGGGHCHGSGGAAGPSALLVEDDEEMGDAILEELFSAVDATGARAEPYPAAASRVPSSASWRPDGDDCLGGRGSGCIAGGSAVDVTGGRRRTVSPVLPAATCISLPYMSKMASSTSYGSRSMCGYAVDGVQASGLGPYLQPTVAPPGAAAAAAYQAGASATKPSWEMRLPPVHDKHPVQFSPLTPEAEAWGNGVGPCDVAMGAGLNGQPMALLTGPVRCASAALPAGVGARVHRNTYG